MSEVNYLGSIEFLMQRAMSVPKPPVPFANEETAIIVPVLNRPKSAGKFMRSLELAEFGHSLDIPLVKVYAVIDESASDEEFEAWEATLANVIPYDDSNQNHRGTFAEKVNAAYRETSEPWMLLVGDDVKFRPMFLDYAQHAARDGAHVIGTNDMQSMASVLGVTTPHPMIRREYVKERGASWDGPGIVCHEGYYHICVDSEIVHLAKLRRVWAFARHAEIEHLNPHYGAGIHDETYEIGKSHYEEDFQTWQRRVGEFTGVDWKSDHAPNTPQDIIN